MKSYRITVNGNVYDVTVEETTGNEAATATHPVSNAGSVEIKSSVPGKIIAVEVSQGQAVKAGDTVVILESMNSSGCTSGWNNCKYRCITGK